MNLCHFVSRSQSEQHTVVTLPWFIRKEQTGQLWQCLSVLASVHKTASQTIPETLEELLVQAAAHAGSFNSRRFALSTLSHLHIVTPVVVPVLLAACQDTKEVRKDAISAAKRFQRIEGSAEEIVALLQPALMGESKQTAHAVALLLGALGTAAAGEVAGLHDAIIAALINAIQDEGSQRVVNSWDGTSLATIYYEVLFQVAGVPV